MLFQWRLPLRMPWGGLFLVRDVDFLTEHPEKGEKRSRTGVSIRSQTGRKEAQRRAPNYAKLTRMKVAEGRRIDREIDVAASRLELEDPGHVPPCCEVMEK